MHERKFMMHKLAHAFIALPGGFGTFDELIEASTWQQLGIHTKPIGLLNIRGFFDCFLQQVDRAVADGFIEPQIAKQIFVIDSDPSTLLDRLLVHHPVKSRIRWLNESQI